MFMYFKFETLPVGFLDSTMWQCGTVKLLYARELSEFGIGLAIPFSSISVLSSSSFSSSSFSASCLSLYSLLQNTLSASEITDIMFKDDKFPISYPRVSSNHFL